MTSLVVFKRGITIGTLTAAQALLPPFIASGTLVVGALVLGVRLNADYAWLVAAVFGLSALLLQPKRAITPQVISGRHQMIVRTLGRWAVLLFLLLAIGYATKSSGEFSRRLLISWALATPALLIFARLLTQNALLHELSDPQNARRAIFVGYNEISVALAERIAANAAAGLMIDGFFDDRSPERLQPVAYASLRGKMDDIVDYVKSSAVEVIFVALPISHLSRVKRLLEDLRDTTVSIYYAPAIFPIDAIQGGADQFLGMPLIALCETPFHGYRGIGKRLTDIGLALLILPAATPVMLIIAALIRLTTPGPALFRQHRYGLDGRRIVVFKFRTMFVMQDGEDISQATRNDRRVTPIGRLLRRTSLDELPQLINVLQGRMSLVGPRPHAVAHNELYRKLIKGYMVRHKVTPGMTGLAQIHGFRGETSDVGQMEARLRYDLEYIRNWTPFLDFKILLKTLAIVVRTGKAY